MAIRSPRRKCDKAIGNGYSPARRSCKKNAKWKIVRKGSTLVRYRCILHSSPFRKEQYDFYPLSEGISGTPETTGNAGANDE